MSFGASEVKKLREKSGAGILDCQKALRHADGDIDAALRYLKEQGIASASSRQGRATAVGRIFIARGDKEAVMLELQCETDFVGRNATFIEFGERLSQEILNAPAQRSPDETVIAEAMAVLKENIILRRVKRFSISPKQCALSYIHGDDGTIGALVIFEHTEDAHDMSAPLTGALFDIVLHVAAFRPAYRTAEDIPAAQLSEQRDIFLQQTRALGKPESMLDKIVEGKINKYKKEITLVDQPFVKDEKMTVGKYLAQVRDEHGVAINIAQFCVLRAGEEE